MKISEIISNLKQLIPPNLISQRQVAGNAIDFISLFDYCDLLDKRVGLWEWEVITVASTENCLFITSKLTIHGDLRKAASEVIAHSLKWLQVQKY